MATQNWPQGQELHLSTSDNKITIQPQVQQQDCPTKIEELLRNLGWVQATTHPDTFEPMWQKTAEEDTEGMYYKWYEAMAYEFYKFVTIASGNDQ